MGLLDIYLKKPSDFGYDMSRIGTEACAATVCSNVRVLGNDSLPDVALVMTHFLRPTTQGSELRSRFWLGWNIVDGEPVKRIPDGSAISPVNKTLDESLEKSAKRRLKKSHPYLVVDARYEKVREDGVIRSQAAKVAIGINQEGRRQILAVEMAKRESESSWRDFLVGLKERGLRGVEFAVADDHPGLKRTIWKVLPEVVCQRTSLSHLTFPLYQNII